jgi:hypothetical protein
MIRSLVASRNGLLKFQVQAALLFRDIQKEKKTAIPYPRGS